MLIHIVRLAHGIGASVVCAAVLYLGGLMCVPRRWDDRCGGLTPALCGAGLYVVLCWIGVSMGVPVVRVAVGFAAAVGVVALVQYRRVAAHLSARAAFTGPTGQSFVAFLLLYVLVYLLTWPPATADYLPPAWTGNLDLMTYVRYTRYLLSLGPSNLNEFSYFNYVYLQTPGLFYLLGGLSLLFEQDPLRAAMPMQFALTALVGTIVAAISRSVFALSSRAALAIACIFVSGSFCRYVAANYFLSTLMAMPILLYLVWTTVEMRAERVIDGPLALRLAAAYVLLLFIYPFLLLAGIGLQMAAIGLMLIAELQPRAGKAAPGVAFLAAGRTLATALAVCAVLGLCFWTRLAWSLEMIVSLSEKGVAGWPLDLISPQAIFAWPGSWPAPTSGAMQVAVEATAWAIGGFLGIAVALVAASFWWFRDRTTPAQRALVGLLAVAIVLYCAYFSALGPSYQQWKFASYSVLPLSFVGFASVLSLLWSSSWFSRAGASSTDRRLLTALPAFVAAALIGGNVAAHAAFDPALRRLPGTLRRIAEVDSLRSFREITVKMSEEPDSLPTWVALYYLPHKKVHVVSENFRPSEPLSFGLVSRHRPLLIHNFGCEGIGHGDTMAIEGLGCLLFAPPTPELGVTYPFNRTFLFLSYQGMTAREQGGRWNTRPTLLLKLLADPERARLTGTTYLNLFLNPFLPAGADPLRLALKWGGGRGGEISVANQEWISLPVRTSDWSGNRVWELPISFDFPDGRTILFHELSLTDAPRGRLVAPDPPGALD